MCARVWRRVSPNGMLLQQPLNGDRELPQEALDNWPTFGELVLDLNLQDVGGKRHETEALGKKKTGSNNEISAMWSSRQGTNVCTAPPAGKQESFSRAESADDRVGGGWGGGDWTERFHCSTEQESLPDAD